MTLMRRKRSVPALDYFLATPLDEALARHHEVDPAAQALALFHDAAVSVPAYRRFLAGFGVEPAEMRSLAAFTAILAGMVTPVSLGLAWTYVGLRALHSLIQCTYNRVMHRFIVYALSSLTLLALWAYLALYERW